MAALRLWAAAHNGLAPRLSDWHGAGHRDLVAGRFPTERTVRRIFGAWETACAAAGLEQRSRRRETPAPAWPASQIVQALRAWAAEHDGMAPRTGDWGGRSSHADYLAARRRWPASTNVVAVFGSWQAACVAAGVTQRPPPSAGRRWSRQQVVQALLDWAAEHDGYAPRSTDWYPSSGEQPHPDYGGQRDRWPSGAVVVKNFGSWRAACAIACLQPRPVRIKPPIRWPRQMIIDALSSWADEHDGQMPRACDWAGQAPHRDYLADRDRCPCTATVARVFGSWAAACATANVTQARKR